MTESKSIIINGVDVSGCSWYTQGATGMICADWHISNDCSKNPNCCFKQLKRIKEIANNYDNCDDIGHYVQDTEARHALEEVAQAMCDISQIIDEVE